MNRPFDSLIFDLDGTLWDSSAVCADAWNRALEKLRMPKRNLTADDLGKIMGMPHKQVFATVFPDHDEPTREKIAEGCYEEEIAAIRDEGGALYAGVPEGIVKLSKHYPLYLVSNCLSDYLEAFFECTGMRKYFRDAECHGGTGKLKFENIRLVKERNKLVSPVYIGDTGSDQSSAAKAGVEFLFVNYGFGTPSTPCPSFETFGDLTDHLLQWVK